MASGSRTTILPQSKEALLKSYNARLKDDVRSMLENFEGINAVHRQPGIDNYTYPLQKSSSWRAVRVIVRFQRPRNANRMLWKCKSARPIWVSYCVPRRSEPNP